MPFLDELSRLQAPSPAAGFDLNLPKGSAYSSFYPTFETQTPQYPVPSIYTLAQAGWRTNEFIYSIIAARAEAVSEAPLRIWDDTGETPEEMADNPIREFMDNINQFLPESAFWGVSEISRCIGGFAAWEIETNNLGEPVKAWYMRPDWCSFIRAQQKPLAFVRYQPSGLPAYDIPIERVLFMSSPTENFDPLYPWVKFVSPTMLALKQISVDTGMTNFLDGFIRHGARFGGLISVAQTLSEDSANNMRERWRQQHGGVENWNDPLILGQGADYKQMQMSFDEMAFPELDARTETRICNAFRIDPIVANARAGLDVSSYNNKTQATKDWYNGWVKSTWKTYASQFGSQMLPRFGYDPKQYFCEFYTDEVYALTEDKTEINKFWLAASVANKITVNEFREQVNLDPLTDPEADKLNLTPPPVEVPGKPAPDNVPAEETPARTEDAKNEEKAFRRFAHRRVQEGKTYMVGEYEFKFIQEDRQRQLLNEFGVMDAEAKAVLDALLAIVDQGKKSAPAPVQPNVNVSFPSISLTAQMPDPGPPVINVLVPEQPAPQVTVTNDVSPTPVTVENEVNVVTPKVTKTTQKVNRDEKGELDNTVTRYEYKD